MWQIGMPVIDRPTGARGTIRCIERVPACHDLFGERVPGHTRLIVAFPDGRWANDRMERDLEPIAS